jgi:galactose mutarotase-like enzyme
VALAYPFPFTLRLRYSLQDGVLRLDGEVANTGAEPLPYAFGFHPYLRAPLASAGARKACSVAIPQGTRLRTTDEWTTATRSPQPSFSLELSDPGLSEGFVLEETGATALEVVDSKALLKTRVSVQDSPQPMPVWAVWSAAPDAEYVCLEPWTDEPNSLNRPGRRTLPAGASHRYRMSIALAAL